MMLMVPSFAIDTHGLIALPARAVASTERDGAAGQRECERKTRGADHHLTAGHVRRDA